MSTCNPLDMETIGCQPFMPENRKGLSISSIFVSECNFNVGYKWVLANTSMTCDKM